VTDPAMLRVSDAERQAAQEFLRRHHLDGRLTVEELEERAGRAQAAVTRADLAALQADLPPLGAASTMTTPAARSPATPGLRRGTVPFTERIQLAEDPDEAFEETVRRLAPAMARCGYELAASTGTWLEFVRTRRPAWTILVAIFVFPIGLIALIHRDERRVTVLLERRSGGGCTVVAHGEAPLAVRQAFADLGG
jgi:hypothetical protein